MRSVIGIIFGNTRSDLLQGLTQERPIAAVPFGGKFRLLDFALSSLVNSGIRTVGLITPQHYRSVLDHTGAGKDWYLDRKSGGLFVLPGANHGLISEQSQFLIKDIALNIEFLEKDVSENVVITNCNQVYNINYRDAINFHEKKQADITMLYKKSDQSSDLEGRMVLALDEGQTVQALVEKEGKEDPASIQPYFIDMFIIRRKLLLELIRGYKPIDTIDLQEAIRDNINLLKVYAFRTNAYIGRIRSIADYFNRNMDLLNPEISEELLQSKNRLYTKVRDKPPTFYSSSANVRDSLLTCECLLDGEVEHSILSRGVVVKPGAKVKNSILMQKCVIAENAVLENVILDKFVEVKEGNVLKGSRNNPLVISKKSMI
ncbi:glucose-1-phosphate adenylyltransferase subunit GlgD [Desulfitobacterium metallireducens]|uniref:Glucose-1-phosphate adenylyltransferase n=1 Tax=Desulfitobacterium metallireducens DSM 15288 TaxID=871968 RepID=W0E7R5_9FIRM|nr:glucose-1-phosphate adenylyltransferase subunit GlgD [Desulfitobacterium metallireducens]AHF06807.1 glucose-1-phosphate adenylyltransferase [Desulfitobacterium metallireducens DSM 15288]